MGVLDRFRLDGKRLFVTGGSRGLGREMALAIADAGADVVLVGRDLASLEKTAADIREHILATTGLLPMPERCPLNPRISGRIERDGYSIREWCARRNVSPSSFYRLPESERPLVLSIGGRKIITKAADELWERDGLARSQAERDERSVAPQT